MAMQKGPAPQNLEIIGMTSNRFSVQFIHNIQANDFQLFVESILSDLMDNVGDTFKATISLYSDQNVTKKSRITLLFPEYHWLSDVGMKISKFVGQHDNLTYVTVGIIDDTRQSLPHGTDAIFTLVAKDGVYIDTEQNALANPAF